MERQLENHGILQLLNAQTFGNIELAEVSKTFNFKSKLNPLSFDAVSIRKVFWFNFASLLLQFSALYFKTKVLTKL